MIALAGATWKLGIRATLQKLVGIGQFSAVLAADNAIAGYEETVARTTAIHQFWATSQQTHLAQEDEILRNQQRRYHDETPTQDWLTRVVPFMGAASKIQLDACINPVRVENWKNYRTQGGYGSVQFQGRGWDKLLVIPYWDLPGRICGFLCIGREGNCYDDWRYVRTTAPNNEAGLGMLPMLLQGNHARLGGTKFIFTDPEMAIRFHVRNVRTTSVNLPLACTWHEPNTTTKDVWRWFGKDKLVFWGPDRLLTLKQAKQADGRIALYDADYESMLRNVSNLLPVERLLRMKSLAVPWQSALHRYIEEHDDTTVEEALLDLDLTGRHLTEFIAVCPSHIQERLSQFLPANRIAKQITFEGRVIVERNDGWYLQKTNEQLCNAIIRIDQVLTTESRKSYNQGVILFNGEEYPFTAPAKEMDNGMFEWVRDYLRDEVQAGIFEYYPSWNTRAIHLALKFHTPDTTSGVDVIGWDEGNRQFNFPKFSIAAGGDVSTDFTCLYNNLRVPGRQLAIPDGIPRSELQALAEPNPETAIVWATAACVIANLIAPAVNRNHVPVLFDGEGAQSIGEGAATLLGCLSVKLTSTSERLEELRDTFGAYRWPVMVSPRSTIRPDLWLNETEAANCLFTFNDYTNLILAMRSQYNVISQTRRLGSVQLCQVATPYIIPNYLQDLYSRSLYLPDRHKDLAYDVLDDMGEWFKHLFGDNAGIKAARKVLQTPQRNPVRDHFCKLIAKLRDKGLLRYGDADFENVNRAHAAILRIEKQNTSMLWISQDRFSEAATAAGYLAPDILLITNDLKEAKLLIDEPAIKKERGWLIPVDWFESQLEKTR